MRRVGRNGDDAGGKAAEERDDERRLGVEEENGAGAGGGVRVQGAREDQGLLAQGGERQFVAGRVVAPQEAKGGAIRPDLCPPMYEVQDGQGFKHRCNPWAFPKECPGESKRYAGSAALSSLPNSALCNALCSVEVVK